MALADGPILSLPFPSSSETPVKMKYSHAALVSLSLATLATAAPSWSNNDNDKPAPPGGKGNIGKGHGQDGGKKKDSKPYVSSKALMGQIYESDLEEGAYVLQGISDRFNGWVLLALGCVAIQHGHACKGMRSVSENAGS